MKLLEDLSSTRVAVGCAVLLFTIGFGTEARAANHEIGTNTTSVDCRSYGGGIRAGDTVILTGRNRSPIKFENCYGAASKPITIKNDTSEAGPLVISHNGDGFATQCVNCEYVVIDGTGKWSGAPAGVCGASISGGEWQLGTKQCGIVMRCASGSPQSGLRLSGSSKNVTVKGVEIDGNSPKCGWGIGLSVNDHKYSPGPNEWREGILLANNYVHDTGRSGIYFGPNQGDMSRGDMQLRNNEIANNYVTGTGCDGIKFKSVIEGSSSIRHNYVTNTGQSRGQHEDGCGANGISLFESGYTDVFSNYVESPAPVADGPGNCIAQSTASLSSSKVKTLPVRIYNNVVHNCKGKGISSTRKGSGNPELIPTIYNNTIVAPVGNGAINVNAMVKNCTVRDNIITGQKIGADQCSTSGNVSDTVDIQKFLSADDNDFRLTASSPAIDNASGQCPSEDLAGNKRPQGGACDSGAYEFVTDAQASAKPRPPATLVVE